MKQRISGRVHGHNSRLCIPIDSANMSGGYRMIEGSEFRRYYNKIDSE